MKQFLLRMPEDRYDALAELAKVDGTSVNLELNEILEKQLLANKMKRIVSLLDDVEVPLSELEDWYKANHEFDIFWASAIHAILQTGRSQKELEDNMLKLQRLIMADSTLNASLILVQNMVDDYIKKGDFES